MSWDPPDPHAEVKSEVRQRMDQSKFVVTAVITMVVGVMFLTGAIAFSLGVLLIRLVW